MRRAPAAALPLLLLLCCCWVPHTHTAADHESADPKSSTAKRARLPEEWEDSPGGAAAGGGGGGGGGGGAQRARAVNNGGSSEPSTLYDLYDEDFDDVATDDDKPQRGGGSGGGGGSDRPADLMPGPEWAPFVSIHPPEVDFRTRSLCSLSTSHFTLFNTHPSESLRVISLTTDTVPFQPLDFKPQEVAADGQLRIAITYLPRSLGATLGTVMLLTSKGSFIIATKGFGVTSPYEVQPLIGAQVGAVQADSLPGLQHS